MTVYGSEIEDLKPFVKAFLINWLTQYGDYIADTTTEKIFNELFEYEWVEMNK